MRCPSEAVKLKANFARVLFKSEGLLLQTAQLEECYGCAYKNVCTTAEDSQLLLSTTSPTYFRLQGAAGCEGVAHLSSLGEYAIDARCAVSEIRHGDGYETAICCALIYFALVICEPLVSSAVSLPVRAIRARLMSAQEHTDAEPLIEEEEGQAKKKRLVSLDLLRGLSLLLMMFVNYGGGKVPVFEHGAWDGYKIADQVFPTFLFVSGFTAMWTYKPGGLVRLLRRTTLMILIGVFVVNRSSDWQHLRFMGVLQRIAVATFVCHFIITLRVKLIKNPSLLNTAVFDGAVVSLFSLIWTVPMLYGRLEGCPRGYLGAGGVADGGMHANCTGGFAKAVDLWMMGADHMYPWPTCKDIYYCPGAFDPEGVWGTITSVLTAYAGVQVASYLIHFPTRNAKLCVSSLLAVWYLAVTALLHYTGVIPVNKNLWSLSYTALTATVSIAVFLVYYVVVDVCGSTILRSRLLVWAGENSLYLFIVHDLIQSFVPITWPVGEDYLSQTLLCLWGVTLNLASAGVLKYFEIRITL